MKNKWRYIHKGIIPNWHEGLMLGNGHLGALIYGEKQIIVSLDRVDLWNNRLPKELKEKGFNYQNMVKTLREDWNEYLRLFDNCYNHPYPTKINAGSIIFHDNVSKETKWDLNIKKPSFKIDNSYSGYLDANKDVLVIRCPQNIDYSFAMPEYLSSEDKNKGLGYPKYKENADGDFRYIIQETLCGYQYGIMTYSYLSDGHTVLLATVFKDEDIEATKKMLSDYKDNLENNRVLHEKYWKKYYATSMIDTGDGAIDRTYNFGRYFLACNSRKDYPMSLEGIWTRNDGQLPPWKGDYHMDINLQMSYESYMKTGNFKEGKVLVDYLWSNRNKFKKLAKTFCHTEGYFIPGVMSQDCTPLGGWPMYALNPCNSIWISSAFDNYYRYTRNKAFLKNKAFPFFQKIEKCISSLLVKNSEGKLQLEFSASPEINDCEKTAILEHQSNFELAMLHYLYRILIEYAHILDIDDSYYKNQQSLLADYSKNENGEMMISQDLNYDVSHRHFSHLLMYKNLENILPYDNKEQILKDYRRLTKYGTKEWVGFSFTEASSLASYINLGEDAYQYLYAFSDAFINKNCFHMNMDYKHKGYSTIQSYAFTLEANIGFVRAVTDMMLRTSDGIITIFPAISQKMQQKGINFKNLRSFNNHKISASIINENLIFDIKLAKKDTIRLFNNIGEHFTLVVDGVEKEYHVPLNEIIEIPACGRIIGWK